MILFSVILLSFGCLGETEKPTCALVEKESPSLFHKVSEGALYFCMGEVLQSASFLSKLGWGVLQVTPWANTLGNECLLMSDVFRISAKHAFGQISKGPVSFKKVPLSLTSWHQNKQALSQIPADTDEQKKLLQFLEKRWLAKVTGYYSSLVNWLCPCFGIGVQIHPESTSSYARDPWNKFSQTYKNRMEEWKKLLPQPENFPLLLTRPHNPKEYLPNCIEISALGKLETGNIPVVVDLTARLADKNEAAWDEAWDECQKELNNANIDLKRILCIQTMQKEGIGGIRILPLQHLSQAEIDLQHQYLLEWISKFGLSANRIELDRWELSHEFPARTTQIAQKTEHFESFITHLNSFEEKWRSIHPQKNLMVRGALEVIRGLFEKLPKDKWDSAMQCQAKSAVIQLSFSKIKEQLKLLEQSQEDSFFNTTAHIEQIHANFTPLLEIFFPFTFSDFESIYHKCLTSIPQKLKPLTSYGIHSSGMTSLGGIFKAMERSLGKSPRILYGENTYFEIIHTIHMTSNGCAIENATEEDWKEADLIIAQFNPVLRRIDYDVTDYKVERIAEFLHKALNGREGKPLTLALDSTIDYINSPQTRDLLEEFQDAIENGSLNIICYRSGLKFDLFGMDNYCGAPLYMIHNKDAKWDAFDFLCSDPVLQTDPLSLNWFCLAYDKAAPHLELYRKQVFDNTRAFFNKIPKRLLHGKNVDYRVIPVDQECNLAFVDIKVYGPLHQLRSSLAGGYLLLKCLEGKHPVFNRPSLGFYHPNFCILFSDKCSTIRLTIGVDPAQVDLLVSCFETIDSLNGSL